MELPLGSCVVVLMGRQVPRLLVASLHPVPPPPLPAAMLTHCSASISRGQQSCHFPCCSCPPLYRMCVMPWRFQFIACASLSVGRAGVKRGEGWGRGRVFEDGSCPRRLCSSGSIIDWLVVWQEALQKIRQKNTMRREVTVELSSQGFWKTGIRSDVCQVTLINCTHSQTLAHAYTMQYILMDPTCEMNSDILHAPTLTLSHIHIIFERKCAVYSVWTVFF